MARTENHDADIQTTPGGRHQPAPVVLTSEGQRRLTERATWLADEQVPKLADDLSGQGEAAWEYETAVAELDRLTGILEKAVTTDRLPPERPGVVELGDEVVVEFGVGDTERFLVVDPIEAPLDDLRISAESPLARALVGHQVGELVDVDAPAGHYRCRIVSTGRHRAASPDDREAAGQASP